MIETFAFDASEYLDTPEAISEYLAAAFETRDPAYVAKAIGTVARARGMTEIAKASGLSRESLYRSLGGETGVGLATVMRVLDALGVGLSTQPAKDIRQPRVAIYPRGPGVRRLPKATSRRAAPKRKARRSPRHAEHPD